MGDLHSTSSSQARSEAHDLMGQLKDACLENTALAVHEVTIKAKNEQLERELDVVRENLRQTEEEMERLKRVGEEEGEGRIVRGEGEIREWKRREKMYREEIKVLNKHLENQGARVSMDLYKMALEEVEEGREECRGLRVWGEKMEDRVKELEVRMGGRRRNLRPYLMLTQPRLVAALRNAGEDDEGQDKCAIDAGEHKEQGNPEERREQGSEAADAGRKNFGRENAIVSNGHGRKAQGEEEGAGEQRCQGSFQGQHELEHRTAGAPEERELYKGQVPDSHERIHGEQAEEALQEGRKGRGGEGTSRGTGRGEHR